MMLPDGMFEVGATAWLGVQAWTLLGLTRLDKKMAVMNERLNLIEKKGK